MGALILRWEQQWHEFKSKRDRNIEITIEAAWERELYTQINNKPKKDKLTDRHYTSS